MNYQYQKVKPEIAPYVRTVLVLKSGEKRESSNLPLFVNGMGAMLCRIKKENCQTTLFGQFVPDEQWAVDENSMVIAFLFKPFSIGPIFKCSVQALKEETIDLNRWNAQKAMALQLQILQAKSQKQQIEVLSHFIFTQIQANKRDCELIRNATDALMQKSNTELSQLVEELCLSERSFQRIFKKYVGTSPSQYKRICQFYFAFSQLKGKHFTKQTDVVYANGYFDQSHYIRSFKEFTDTTPSEYLQKGLSGGKKTKV